MKNIILIASIVLSLISCSNNREENTNTITHILDGSSANKTIQINLPKRFLDITIIDDILENKSINEASITKCIDIKYSYPNLYNIFVDTINFETELIISSVRRINIEENHLKPKRSLVPTVRIEDVFPVENDNRKIIEEIRNQKIKGKIYYKRQYKISENINFKYLTCYLISTGSESIIIAIKSKKEKNLEKYIKNISVSRG